jgi:TRAP-type C4-dicarboxylate transport system substrate-binding protein
MMKKVLLLVFVVLVVCSTYASAEVIKLTFANYLPPMHMVSPLMDKYCEELNKKLAGKAEVTHYSGGTLLTAPKMAAGVASGIADIGLSHCAYSRGRFPVTEIMELPLGFPSSWIATHVINDFYNKFKPKEWDTYHVLMFSTSPPNILQTLNKPVKTLEELKGLKIRGTGRLGDIVKTLGAIPMPIETVDLYEALRRGVIDGSYLPLETFKGYRIGEVEKYATASWKVGSVFAYYVIMNKQRWNSLPPDVKKTITDFSRDFIERWAVEWNNIDIEGREFFLKQGGKIIPVSETESAKWVKASEPVIAEFKKDLISKGYKAAEIDSWFSFIKERIEYWKGQEKAKKIRTAYDY